ncbi:hypothetical protein JQ543_28235 [Bradyrhizobium diazoefficiens]|nr:hypothetical protein [Bradyrhizobium diazoefficiens]
MTNLTTKILPILFAFAMTTGVASAQSDSSGNAAAPEAIQRYVSADTLLQWCRREPAKALYYVAGALDALMLATNDVTRNRLVCIPAAATLEQARDVVCRYLGANPAKRQYNTATLVWTAQSQAWPCKSQ